MSQLMKPKEDTAITLWAYTFGGALGIASAYATGWHYKCCVAISRPMLPAPGGRRFKWEEMAHAVLRLFLQYAEAHILAWGEGAWAPPFLALHNYSKKMAQVYKYRSLAAQLGCISITPLKDHCDALPREDK
ncbi:hypothetical protein DFP72DRAFT_848675 [Ephemerocybe angulata]|uniref:Uncharacterized protein n=1 Tax=Ephemerocybe angulata TaxID=980116 RepID=A0A8H6M3E0_9AGAR|nr:hypothetical protein DFP72DRAFT_848675 [Tulosesus angulatus]